MRIFHDMEQNYRSLMWAPWTEKLWGKIVFLMCSQRTTQCLKYFQIGLSLPQTNVLQLHDIHFLLNKTLNKKVMENMIVMGKREVCIVSKTSKTHSWATMTVTGSQDSRRLARAEESTWRIHLQITVCNCT